MGEFVPLYRQVSQRIFRKIQQGVYNGSFFRDPRLRQEFLFLQKVAAGKFLGDLFNIKGNSPVWLLGRRWMAENMVVALEYSYFPVKWIPDFSKDLCTESWKILFTQRQLMPSRIEQTVRGVRI